MIEYKIVTDVERGYGLTRLAEEGWRLEQALSAETVLGVLQVVCIMSREKQ